MQTISPPVRGEAKFLLHGNIIKSVLLFNKTLKCITINDLAKMLHDCLFTRQH
jgi:hypothetical protein